MSLPSPSPSETSTATSKKRVRSPSMVADEPASSPKRSLSEVPSLESSTLEPSTSAMNLDGEEDAYMALQGEQEGENLALPPAQATSSLSPIEKLSIIERLKQSPMEVGDVWYIVSSRWYKRFKKACTGEADKAGPCTEADLGPVDNTGLLNQAGVLTEITEGVDIEFFPKEAFFALEKWYGPCPLPISREIILRGGPGSDPIVELTPLRFTVYQVNREQTITGPPPTITLSRKSTVTEFCNAMANALVSTHGPSRVWQIPAPTQPENTTIPASDFRASMILLNRDGKDNRTLEEAVITPDEHHMVEFKDATRWILPTPVETTTSPPPLFGGNQFFSSGSFTQTASTALSKVTSFTNNSFKAPVSTLSIEPGTLGLGNMGNTCFMNSALQCLVHTHELAEYFLTDVYMEELNPDNPLGMKGAIAQAFAELVKRIWANTTSTSSYMPREFKSQLQRFAPQFSGYQQHDSQELVAFLLDGLHEDLNRVKQKPYVEKPDWEGGGLKELVKLAQTSWDGYMKRNDSVIVDLFQGQYQSTLVCPECKKVSITFDPFMYLTLPLPVKKMWNHTVHFIPWELEKPHLKIRVQIGRDASFKELRQLIGRWMDVPAENLLTLEVWKSRFYKNLHDGVQCTDMADSDTIVCFQLPCNSQQARTFKRAPEDPYILPIFFAQAGSQRDEFGRPTIVVIPAASANDPVAIKTAVTESISRWTKDPSQLWSWEQADTDVTMDPISIDLATLPTTPDTMSEFQGGNLVDVTQAPPPPQEEGDITEESRFEDEDTKMDISGSSGEGTPRRTGPKDGAFEIKQLSDMPNYGISGSSYGRFLGEDALNKRLEETPESVLREDDALVCLFDEHMKDFYFGTPEESWKDRWQDFTHPEYEAAKKEMAESSDKVITLQGCLDEFTKKEKLGEDDLWYCPECKKHQQASKQFELWKAPDVLVVHLKRFSNSRLLRDKIDDLVDFPTHRLDLGAMVGERKVAKELVAAGEDIAELGLDNMDEELIYDLFAVDEHMGGLSGGHYRAYAMTHSDGKWHHFDDSHVTPAEAKDSVTPNAYLLFYRRRTHRPLGGKTHEKIMEARSKPKPLAEPPQLPTPPNEPTGYLGSGKSRLTASSMQPELSHFGSGSGPSSPLDPLYDEAETASYPSTRASPTSSTEAEGGDDADTDDYDGDGPPQWNANEPFQQYSVFNNVPSYSESAYMRNTTPAPEPIVVDPAPVGRPTDFDEIE